MLSDGIRTIGYVWYINILTQHQSFQEKLLYSALTSLFPSLLRTETQKRQKKQKNTIFHLKALEPCENIDKTNVAY